MIKSRPSIRAPKKARGANRMADSDKIPQIDPTEIEILIEKLEQNKLEERERRLIVALLRTFLYIVAQLQEKKITLLRIGALPVRLHGASAPLMPKRRERLSGMLYGFTKRVRHCHPGRRRERIGSPFSFDQEHSCGRLEKRRRTVGTVGSALMLVQAET
jgi:hypothetical protein